MLELFLLLVGAEGYDFNPKLFLRWIALALGSLPAIEAVADRYDFEDEFIDTLGVEITPELLDKVNEKLADDSIEKLKEEFTIGCHIRACAGLTDEILILRDALVSREAMQEQIDKLKAYAHRMEEAVMRNLDIDLDSAPQEHALKEAQDYLKILEILIDEEPILFAIV